MDDIIYNSLRLSLAILSFADKSQGLSFERFVCEQFQTELNCTVGNSIDDINITFHDEQNDCSDCLTNDVYKETPIALDSASYPSCIGHNSCVLTDKIINVSNSVADKTRKVFIQYHCVHTSNQHHNPKKPQKVCPFNMESVACESTSRKIEIQSVEFIPSCSNEINQHHNPKDARTVCPFNMESVKCGNRLRKIEIQSVELMQCSSFCEKQMTNNSCTELIHQKVNTSSNGKQKCEPLIWNESVFTWDDCIRIPKLFNISFSCVKAIPAVLPMQGENNVEGVAVGVTVGIIIIVGIVVVLMWFVKSKSTDDKHNIARHHDKKDDNIGNQDIAIPANCNSEMSTNINLGNYNHKGTNKGETVNELVSNFETRNNGQIIRPYSNSAIYSIALEPSEAGCHVQHLNAYDYEMAKPINDSKYDKKRPVSEKDNDEFHEDQYDISGKNDGSDHQQGIYSKAVDTVYDIASHSRQNNITDQTYDHAYGPTTEDDYDLAKN